MKLSEKILGRTAVIEVLDNIKSYDIDDIFEYLKSMERIFSTRFKFSEISKINNRQIDRTDASIIMRKVLELCHNTQELTHGYFKETIGKYTDLSGLLKGYLISESANLLLKKNYVNFYIQIGSDIYVHGLKNNKKWKVGIGDPRNPMVITLSNKAISTSGMPSLGSPIYNPINLKIPNEIQFLTLIGENALDADRFSTAIVAMGIEYGMNFLSKIEQFEAILLSKHGKIIKTKGFEKYISQ